MSRFTMILDGRHPPALDGYTYRIPILSKINPRDISGLSLEEVREKFGDDAAQNMYFDACHGLSSDKVVDEPGFIDVNAADMAFDTGHDGFLELYVLPNEFTRHQEAQIMSIHRQHVSSADMKDIKQRMIEIALTSR